MLEGRYQRGFSDERLSNSTDPRVRRDENGFYTMSLSENTKVYFEDFYRFLELTYENATNQKNEVLLKLSNTPPTHEETIAYYRAKSVILDLVLRTARRFYCDGGNFGVVMTPWCFGTVILEKVEVYRERVSKGEISDPNIPEYPFYVIKYIEEIYKTTLLELFDFPENAFHMRWQYSELLKRYSKILTNITDSLNSVLKTVKNYGS